MLQIHLCTNCKRSLTINDINAGHAVYQEGGKFLCKECLSVKIRKEKGYEEKDFVLESILNEVKNEIKEQTLSSEKAKSLLNWQPSYSLEEGLKRTIEWYKKNGWWWEEKG